MVRRHFQHPETISPIAPPTSTAASLDFGRKGVKSNPKNEDSRVWRDTADSASYFFRADQADIDRRQREIHRQKVAERRQFLQLHHAAMETARWERETEHFHKERELDEQKRLSSHMGLSSVHYSPLTQQYQPSPEGEQLQNDDRQVRARVDQRGRCLYHKANTFNPVTGEDIPQPPDLLTRSWVRRY